MSAQPHIIQQTSHAIDAYLARHEHKSLLRLLTCGSVDDGKSTLLGRLLYDSHLLFEDQLAKLKSDSAQHGTQGDDLDFALLVDGLSSEREQGITIDVAYRFFSTEQRKFIVADCPGHEQYTRNMATGASTADLAIVLVDARKGLLTQTRRHTWICSLLGIRHIVLAVNKMDLANYDQQAFESIANDYQQLAQSLGIQSVQAIPLSALKGDNISAPSEHMPWYKGLSLLAHLKQVDISHASYNVGFRLPVQWVCRPNHQFRGFAGEVAAGEIAVGDEVVVLPSAKQTKVKSIVTYDGNVERAQIGDAITLTLEDEVDISRGDVIAAKNAAPQVSDEFSAQILWLADAPCSLNKSYRIKIGTRTVNAQVTAIDYTIDINTQAQHSADALQLNEVASCTLSLDQAVVFEPYALNHQLGAFILIDRVSNVTVAAGTLSQAKRSASDIHWQNVDVNSQARAKIKGQQSSCLWFTGLSGAGKSTIANLVEKRLHALGYHTYLLDGDNVRHGLNKDLGFSAEDRTENIRRIAEVAKLMTDAGLIVLVSFISPFKADRDKARQLFDYGVFKEVFIDTPIEVCAQRDVKGLYAKAQKGEMNDFTGVSSPYEVPENAEFVLATDKQSAEALAEALVQQLLST